MKQYSSTIKGMIKGDETEYYDENGNLIHPLGEEAYRDEYSAIDENQKVMLSD